MVHATASGRLQRLILKALILGPLMAAGQTLTITSGVQTYSSLTNTAVTMTGRCELRVTATNNPIPGCTINLNSSNAWLFLTGLKPSVVAASYLGQVLVNGASAVADSNVRVVQYGAGAVVIPQPPSFQPLQVFSGPQFAGASAQYSQYVYYTGTGLGAMDMNISSFKLKRGYMAVLAQNTSGNGISKCYVAQDGDLEVSLLPSSLDNRIRFIYVTPWRWVNKKGIAGDPGISLLNVSSWYNWNISASSSRDLEYVAIEQQPFWPGLGQNWQALGINTLLGYNEPDNSSQDAYKNLSPPGSVSDAVAKWPALLATGLRVGSPATTDGGRYSWLYPFVSQADAAGERVDFVAVHYYQAHNPADPAGCASQMYNFLLDIWNNTHRPIWITEWNNGANWTDGTWPAPTYAQQQACVAAMVSMLESAPFVERYQLYNWVEDSRAVVTNGVLTAAGVTYRDQVSGLSYQQALPDNGGRSFAQFLFETNTLDSSGYGNNGLAVGAPAYTGGHSGQAIVLDGTNSYVQLPPNVSNGTNFSFAAWMNWNGGGSSQHIFDFGNDTTHYLYLTPSSSSGTLRFVIRNGGSEQIVETTGLASGQWQHVAITLSGNTAKIYTNGVLAASSSSFTIAPSSFSPMFNYLGKSQFATDPLFQGYLDEVQIADYALTDSQIAALQTNNPPQFTTNLFDRGTAAPYVTISTNITGTATDPDSGDTLTYSKAAGLAWLTVNADGTLTGTPGADDGGTNYFTVRVTDLAGASAFAMMTIYVPITYGNGIWTNDASGNWGDATNWSGGAVANGVAYTADFSTANITADRTVTLEVARSIGALKFGDTSGAQNWTLTSGGDPLTLNTGSTTSPSIVVSQNTATIAALLDGTNGFTKSGSGTLVLSGANSFSGALNVDTAQGSSGNDGVLKIASPGGLGNVTTINIRNQNAAISAFQLDGTLGNISSSAAITLNGRNNTVVPIENLSGSNTLAGGISINTGGGNYWIQSDAGTLNLGGTITSLASGTRTFTFQGSGDFYVSGSIQNGSATANLTKTGSGTLTLAGANTFSGTNRITGGALILANSAALQNSVLDMNASDAGTLSFGTLTSASLGGLTGSRNIALTNISNTGVTLTVGSNGQSLTYSGVLSGSGSLVKINTNTLTLSSANTFTGTTRVSGGTLALASSAALQNSTLNLDVGTLSFGSLTSATVGALAGSRNLALTNNSNAGVTLTVGGNDQDAAYAGVLSGSGNLIKQGAGSLTLSSSNNYSGNTIINAGTVKLSRDPVAKFTFDSVSGATVGSVVTNTGSGGTALNAVVTGSSVSYASGKFGNALSISGGGAYLKIANPVVALDPAANWTVALWIKTTTAGAAYLYQGDGSWGSGNTQFYLNNGNTAAGSKVGGVRYAGGWLTGTTAVNDGNWHFIAMTDNGSAQAIYVDGNVDSLLSSMTHVANGSQVWIGGRGDTGDGTVAFNGQMDELYMFNRALSQVEVRSLTNSLSALTVGNFGGQLPSATPLYLASGATFDLGGNSQTVGLLADYSGGGGTITNSGIATTTLTFGTSSGTSTFSGVIADAAATNAISIVKNGAATEILSGANACRGTTTVNAGTLLVNGSLGAGAVIVAGGMLGGAGTLDGSVTIQAAGTLSPGSNVIGWLTINNALTNSGVLLMELSKTGSALTNDTINGLSVLALGGALSLTNIGTDFLTVGDSFKLFSATNYTGAFANIVPATPGAGLAWDASSLTVNGTLAVALGAVNPQIARVFLDGTNLVLSGAGGAAGYDCSVLTATNVTGPMANWQVAGSGVCDVNGNFAFTNAVGLDDPQRFYRVRVP